MKHLTWILLLTGGIATAQELAKTAPDKNELKYNLNSSGTYFFKATFLNQTWVRFNQRKEAGSEKKLAAVEAAVARFRPIVMTSLCTILGILPIVKAIS